MGLRDKARDSGTKPPSETLPEENVSENEESAVKATDPPEEPAPPGEPEPQDHGPVLEP